MINMAEYEEVFEELAEDHTVHVNHKHCSAGEDRKKRLYFTRKPSCILAYCHHCGESGYKSLTDEVRSVDKVTSLAFRKEEIRTDDGEPPPVVFTLAELHKWPIEEKLWWMRYGIAGKWEGVDYTVGVASDGGILISTETATVHRHLSNRLRKVTMYKKKRGGELFIGGVTEHTLVIVEDIVSAIKIAEVCEDVDVLCLFGTHLHDNDVAWIAAKRYNNAVVWLDDDWAGIHAAMDVYKRLAPLVNNLISVRDTQPKECSVDLIKEYCDV